MADVGDKRFKRGQMFHNTGAEVVSADQGGQEFEGMVGTFADVNPSTKAFRSRGDCVCVWVRNASAIALLPKQIVRWKSTEIGKQVDGYTTTTGQSALVAGVIDEWLPAAGCQVGDCCWICVKGPTLVNMPATEVALGEFSAGTQIVALTAATSQGTDAGRLSAIDAAAASTNDITYATQISPLGTALTSMTSSQTGTGALCNLDLY